jgi:uncharacterized protein (DUF302 family)
MYGFTVTVPGTFDEVVNRVVIELKKEGFGVLTEIDIQATMKAKLGVDGPAYKILGACNPELAHRALEAEPDIGLLLPCNVIVRALESGDNVVGFMDPKSVLGLVEREELEALGEEVLTRMQRVRDAVAERT